MITKIAVATTKSDPAREIRVGVELLFHLILDRSTTSFCIILAQPFLDKSRNLLWRLIWRPMPRIQEGLLIQLRQPPVLNRRIHGLGTARGIVLPSNIQYRNIDLVSILRKVLVARVLLLQKGAIPALRCVEAVTAHSADEFLAELCVLSVRAEFRGRIAIGEVLTHSVWGAEEALHRVACAMEARVETLNVVCEDLAAFWVGEEVPNKEGQNWSCRRSSADFAYQ